jgi:adenylate cyclase
MAAVWPGRVVEESNLTVHMSALRRVLDEGGDGTNFIQTDPGRGYRFAAPVVETPAGETKNANLAAAPHREKPSIAALPFENMSSDPDQAYFADGMVEDIITELSRSRSLFVVSRNSSFTYRGKTLDIRQVAAELGVRYVLEGSVRRNAQSVRVNAQLIDAETGGHVWAERYDRGVSDVFAVQDEITRAVTMAIEPAVAGAEQLRAVRLHPENLGAWEAFHRGMWHLEQVDAGSNATARALFEKAIALDPRFGAPHAWVVHTYLREIYYFFSRDNTEAVRLAENHGLRAVALDPNDSAAHAALGWTAVAAGDLAGGLARCDRALVLNPNNVDAHRCRASTLLWLDRMEEARDVCQLCLRLSPRDVRSWITMHHLTMIEYLTRDYEATVRTASRVLDAKPASVMPHRWLAAALGRLGRQAEAADVIRRVTEMVAPRSFAEYAREKGPWMGQHHSEHLLEGLRHAGWTG